MNAQRNWTLVRGLINSVGSTGSALAEAPAYLRKVLAEGSWRSFTAPSPVGLVEPGAFEQFVTDEPPRGLGATVRLVKKVIASIEDNAERAATEDLLDQAMQGSHGGDRRSRAAEIKPDVISLETGSTQYGTSRDGALRRLRKDAPELHAEVLAGNLSAHAAMVQAGFRPKTVSVPMTRPESVAKALRTHMTAEDIATLIRLLLGGDDA